MVQETRHEILSPGQTYFDLQGDKDMRASSSCDEPHLPLTWRGDPNETYSDWSIVVVTNELETVTYNVHKSVICFGSRQAKYFARIMLNHSVDKRKRFDRKGYSVPMPTTKIELDQRDAGNFPVLLDYIYASNGHLSSCGTVVTAASTITSHSLTSGPAEDDASLVGGVEDIATDNAVSLRYLAKRFEVEAMVLAVNRFIQRDLNFKTGPFYLSTAAEYKDKRLMESAQRLCAENIEQISSKALIRLPKHLFRVVIKSLESFDEDNCELSRYLSEIVCRYLEKNLDVLDSSLLLELTDPLLMPCIASEAAIGFTALVKELNIEDSRNHWVGITSLSRRCAKAVVEEYGWNDFSVDAAVDEYLGNIRPEMKEFTEIDSLLFATSFAAALERAQDDYEDIMVGQEHLENLVETLGRSVTVLEQHNDMKEKYMRKQQAAIEEAERQILDLKEEIGVLRRRTVESDRQLNHSTRYQDELSIASPVRELVAPSQVGAHIYTKKSQNARELMTKNEMRARSLM